RAVRRSGEGGAPGRDGEYSGSGEHECEALDHEPAPWRIDRHDRLSWGSWTVSMAAVAFLNSWADSPRLRASLGSLAAPNRSMKIARTMMSSVGPRFTGTPFSREGRVRRPGSPGGAPAHGCIGWCRLLLAGRDLLE